MHTRGDVAREQLLCLALLRLLARHTIERLDVAPRKQCEEAEVSTHVAVVRVHPELIEGVWRSEMRIEPHGIPLGFPELGAGRGRDERRRQRMRLGARCPTNEL